MRSLHVASLVLLSLSSGCAGRQGLSPRAATALITVGALVTTVGVLTSAGCPDLSDDGTGCGEGSGDRNLAVGIPMTAAGVTLLTVAALKRWPKSPKGTKALPRPQMPDPFVQPISP